MKLTIVIPAYNEEHRLPDTLEKIQDFFQKEQSMELFEVIVVDDGSTDRTSSVIRQWEDRLPISSVHFSQNKGKGAALRAGVQKARGEYILLYDADAATPIGEVLRLFEVLSSQNADIAIGSRVLRNEHSEVDMEFHRRLIGRLYHVLTAPLIPGIADAACGCKLFKAEIAKKLFSLQTINRYVYDIEILSLAHVRGHRIVEVPVCWRHVPVSKVRLLRDGFEMLWRVFGLYVRKIRS